MGVHHPYITGPLLGVAVLLAFLCSLGLAVMRDPYQRLHFATSVVSLSTFLIAIAVWLEDSDPQARIKVILIGLILFLMNAILSHATGRAVRIRQLRRWYPRAKTRFHWSGRTDHPNEFGNVNLENEAGEMNLLQLVILLFVAVSGTAVVLTRNVDSQVIGVSFFGLILALMFLLFQAADVALSQIVIGTVGLPLMVLLAIAKMRRDTATRQEKEDHEKAEREATL